MSDPALVARRGILGSAVAAKASLYRSIADRRILFHLQGLSMQRGGIKGVAEDIVTAFPDRFSQSELPAASLHETQMSYAAYLASAVPSDESTDRRDTNTADDVCLGRDSRLVGLFAEFLENLCININFDLPQIRATGFCPAVSYVRDPIALIEEFRQRMNAIESARSPAISLGRAVHSGLDCALSSKRMVVIEAKSASGKTHPAESWCHMHQGEARYISLSGITHRTSFFQAIGAAIGLGISQQASSKTQARVEAFLVSTRLMLVIDEAHFAWPQHLRSHSAPELVDWIDTMVNAGVPIALITTDQFQNLKARAEKTGWTSDQFTHRIHRYFQLDSIKLTLDDVTTAVRSMLSRRYSESAAEWLFDAGVQPDAAVVKLIATRAFGLGLPLAAARAIVDAAQFVARNDSSTDRVTLVEVKAALKTQEASDLAIRNAAGESPAIREATIRTTRHAFSLPTNVRLSNDSSSHTRAQLEQITAV